MGQNTSGEMRCLMGSSVTRMCDLLIYNVYSFDTLLDTDEYLTTFDNSFQNRLFAEYILIQSLSHLTNNLFRNSFNESFRYYRLCMIAKTNFSFIHMLGGYIGLNARNAMTF